VGPYPYTQLLRMDTAFTVAGRSLLPSWSAKSAFVFTPIGSPTQKPRRLYAETAAEFNAVMDATKTKQRWSSWEVAPCV
jgi:hypothetical protein